MRCPYTQDEPYLRFLARRYERRLPTERGEMYSVVCERYVEVCHRHDPTRAPLPQYIRIDLPRRLNTYVRDVRNKTKRLTRLGFNPVQRQRFDIVRWKGELSKDAQYVIGLFLDPPPEVQHDTHESPSYGPSLRKAVVRFLKDLHWWPSRIRDVFNEIKEALP